MNPTDNVIEETAENIRAHREVVRRHHENCEGNYSTGAVQQLKASPACLDSILTPPEPPKQESTSDRLERWEAESWDRRAAWLAWYGNEVKKWPSVGREEAAKQAEERAAKQQELRMQEIGREVDRDLQWKAWLGKYHRDMARIETEAEQRAAQHKWNITLLLADEGQAAIEDHFRNGDIDAIERADALAELKGRTTNNNHR